MSDRETPAGRATAPVQIDFKPPLAPQRRWLMVLSIIFALWVLFLIGLYVKTVYPLRHSSPAPIKIVY
jgi:hypothetical protein